MAHPVVDQVRDGADLDAMGGCEGFEVRTARHAAVFIEDLDDDRGGFKAGQPGQVTTRLRMARAHQDPTGLGHHREDVPRLHQVTRLRLRGDRSAHGRGTIGRRDAGGHALGGLDRDGEGGAMGGLAVGDHQRQTQALTTLFGQGEAVEPATELGHEVDRLRGHALGGQQQIALILAVFVVHDDDHATRAQLVNDLFGAVKGHGWDYNNERTWGPGRAATAERHP